MGVLDLLLDLFVDLQLASAVLCDEEVYCREG